MYKLRVKVIKLFDNVKKKEEKEKRDDEVWKKN